MILIERYIFRRAFTYAAGATISLVAIIWIVQALTRIDVVKTSASAASNVFWIALMLVPDLAAGIIPFALLIGAVQALNSLNADSERAVISAAGASFRVIVKPILGLGLVGAVIMLLIAHIIGPMASSAFQNGLRSINADTITLFLKPGRFEQIQPDLVIGIDTVNGSTIKGLVIADNRDPQTDLTYFAREAQIVDDNGEPMLLLYDGQLHRHSVNDGTTAIIEFQTYAFDLAALKPANDGDWTRSSELSTPDLIWPSEADRQDVKKVASMREELTDRLTNWLYAIAFSLWAVVVAGHASTNRQGTGPAMTLGLTGALGLKALGFVALSQAGNGPIWVAICYALPIASILSSAFFLWRNIDIVHWSPLAATIATLNAARHRIARSMLPGGEAQGPAE